MVGELALPLPRRFTVFIYLTHAEYTEGLVREGLVSGAPATKIAEYSVGVARSRRLLVNDEAFRGARRGAWLGVLAHELTHVAQYELSGGRRGRSEQWLREGMADWVAYTVLERLGEDTFRHQRQRALTAVVRALPAIQDEPRDLVVLGSPAGWAARSARSGRRPIYGLAFLLTDELIRRHGFQSLIAYFGGFVNSDDRFGHFQRAFGRSLEEFQSEALEQIRSEVEQSTGELMERVFVPDAEPEARLLDRREEMEDED